MSGTLRAGLIGLGMMGRNHVRVLQSLPDVELVAAVDPLGRPHHTSMRIEVLHTVRELIDRGIDFCVVATPTRTHQVIGQELAEAGVPALIEKPLAHDGKAAQAIVEAFARNGVLGCVGHIERFNPALQDLRRRLACGELGTLYQLATRRQQPFPVRIADTGVILDLATHDIDLTAWVTDSTYRSVSACVAHRRGSGSRGPNERGSGTLQRYRRHPPGRLAVALQGAGHDGNGRTRLFRCGHSDDRS